VLAVVLWVAGVVVSTSATQSFAAGRVGVESGSWVLRGWTTRPEDYTDQGLATLGTRLVTRGDDSVPAALAAAGWQHVGDPDAYRGYLLDAYQGAPTSRTKLFVLTTPTGARYRYVHPLLPGEAYNNSFTAIAPGARWFVAGGWGTVRRLLVFRMPALAPTGPRTRDLPLASVITWNRPVRDVQGCDFSSATTLQCSTNDRSDELFGVAQQLLTVRLARPLDGRPVHAAVSVLGAVPGVDACQGRAEVEGIDVHARRMLVAVVAACSGTTTLFDYRLEQA
jgi:hypothetical protein